MSDLISRQAVIDIVLEYAKRLHEPVGTPEDNEMYSYGRGMLLSIERNLKQLPSAQTETCEGCKHLRKWENEVENGYLSPCTCCKRRVKDYYER